jgi:hypothetical protein
MKQGQLYAWKLDFNQSYQFDQYPFLSQGFEYPIILLPYTCMKVQSMQSDLEFKYNTHEHDNQVPINSIYVLQYQDDYILSTSLVPTMILNGLNLITHNITGEMHSMPIYKVRQDGHAPEQMIVLGFGSIKLFYESSECPIEFTNVPLCSRTIAGMHIDVSGKCTFIFIQRPLHVTIFSPMQPGSLRKYSNCVCHL